MSEKKFLTVQELKELPAGTQIQMFIKEEILDLQIREHDVEFFIEEGGAILYYIANQFKLK